MLPINGRREMKSGNCKLIKRGSLLSTSPLAKCLALYVISLPPRCIPFGLLSSVQSNSNPARDRKKQNDGVTVRVEGGKDRMRTE